MGLSSNEIKAAKLGMSVSQYKKLGKPKVAPKKSSSSSNIARTSSGTPDYVSMIKKDYYSTRGQINPEHSQEYTEFFKEAKKEDDKKKKSSSSKISTPISTPVNTSQRESAVLGASTSKTPNIVASNPTKFGSFLQGANEGIGKALNLGGGRVFNKDYGVTENSYLNDILNLFGVPSVNAALRDNPATGGDYRNPNTVSAINYSDIGGEGEQRAIEQQLNSGNTPTTNYTSTNNNPWSTPRKTNNDNNNNDRRTPSPVNNPFVPQPNPYQAPTPNIYQSISPQSQPDYGNNQGDQGTVQRMGGRGAFSTGEFANGGGGYGFSGNIGGSPVSEEEFLLNQLLGINTTQAQEGFIPDQNQIDAMNAEENAMLRQGGFQGIGNNGINTGGYSGGATGGYQGTPTGGAQQQPTGGSQGYDAQVKQQEKLFKQQEKAQKKALEELIKSIKSQYSQSQTEGTTSLEKSKQEDLLKLSGLFGFANQDPNSEQRMQYEQRSRNDYAGQLADFLAKLSTAQNQEIGGARQNYQGNLSNIASQRAQAMQQLQQARQEQEYKMAQLMQKAQPRYNAQTSSGIKESEIYQVQQELGVSRTQALKLLQEEANA